jgi:hypothetical protein
MTTDWTAHAEAHYGALPHIDPETGKASAITNKEWPVALEMATAARFGGHAAPAEVESFWPQFKALGMEPDHFLQLLDHLGPLFFRYHDRPPSMREIAMLKDGSPADARKYVEDLPDKDYPEVTAGQMVHSLVSAHGVAREHIGRAPAKGEVATFITGRYNSQQQADYYRHQKELTDVRSQARRDASATQPASPWRRWLGRPTPDQGVAGPRPAPTGGAGDAQDGTAGSTGAIPSDRYNTA